MCIIAVSRAGVKQPTLEQLRTCFENNPHGAGYMYARRGKVTIHKGFMDWADFERAVKQEHFTDADPVVYHFRISTQAGVQASMTHPFPLSEKLEKLEKLDLRCPIGMAHNGIIRMTSYAKETRFSDTALFIADYMTRLIRTPEDLTDPAVLDMIDVLTNSKWALLDGASGDIYTIGKFEKADGGLLFSNATYKRLPKTTIIPPRKFSWDDYENGYYGIQR